MFSLFQVKKKNEFQNFTDLLTNHNIFAYLLFQKNFEYSEFGFCEQGGFQLEFVSIRQVINHMTCYKFELKLQHSDWRTNLVKDFF